MKTKIITLSFIALSCLGCQKTKEVANSLDPNSLHNRSVGSSANELLSAAKYKSLKVEIQYMAGFAPDAGALNHLQAFLSASLNKPNGINIVLKEITASGKAVLTADEVHAIEKANRSAFTSNDEIAVYILYTNGEYTDNNVLGVAYRNTSAALFGKKIRDNSGGLGQASRTKLEATVLEHEVAHLLGLVDIGTKMQSPHKANGNHCSNQNCLMYYASETTDVLGFLLTGNIPALDANCLADLKANGGK
ncbi:MAG TPA: M12 family metallo-peptidase [Flavisolibacter sp.]